MIRFQNILKRFDQTVVLHGVSGHIPQGSVVALLGPSGSGKSTLLRCLNLLERPDAGELYIDATDLMEHGAQIRKARESIGMVFQQFNLFPHMTVLQNITYAPIRVLGLSRADAEQRAWQLLERVGLGDKAMAYPSRLSGGQKQRVAIARSLAMQPKIMLFDEPTSALDPEMVKEVLDVIKSLAHTGITIVIVTHEMRFAREVADEIWFLDHGQILEKTAPEKFFQHPQSQRARQFLENLIL